jgi:hypothetical protein
MDSRLALLTLASCMSVATGALAQSAADKETARSLMDQGLDLREHKDLKAALARLVAADEIMHVPTTAIEVARTQEMLGLLVECRDTLARIITSIPSPREPPQFREARANAQALDASLESRVPAVTVTVSGAAADTPLSLSVDGVAVPAAVIGLPRRLNPGHHVMVASTRTSEGREEVDVVEGEKKDVKIILAPVATRPAAPTTPEVALAEPPPPAPEAHRSYVLPAISFSVGGAGLVVGAVTGLLMLSKQSDLSTTCPNHVCGPSRYGDLDSANALATTSTVAFVVGGVGVVVGVVALLVGKPSATTAPARAAVQPWIGAGTAGVRGSF